jgi:hypothetical protein
MTDIIKLDPATEVWPDGAPAYTPMPGYMVTAKLPASYHATGEPAVTHEPAVIGEAMPEVGLAYDLVKSMMERSTLPAGTEVRIIYVWDAEHGNAQSLVSVNWIKK